jgi:hypothetical protein
MFFFKAFAALFAKVIHSICNGRGKNLGKIKPHRVK